MKKTRVLILGGGFAGVYCARELDRLTNEVEITMVSEENFFLFTPLLHEVATARLGITDAVSPLRQILPKQCVFYQGKVNAIDLERKTVDIVYGDNLTHHRAVEYDQLVLALGSETNFHDTPGVEENANRMKTLADAIALRNKLISNLEKAQVDTDEDVQRRRLTFLVCGGGFAGVETVGAIRDFVSEASKKYDEIRPEMIRVLLVHPEETLLPELPGLGEYAAEQLRRRGVEVVLKARLTEFENSTAKLDNGVSISTDTVIWTAGIKSVDFAGVPDSARDKKALRADEYLRLGDLKNVWVAGDCARIKDTAGGGYLPPTAQHALREGKHIGRNIFRTLRNLPIRKFSYHTKGQMASIGAQTAVAQVFGRNIVGFPAWWLWRTFYLLQVPDLRKQLRVVLNWTLDLVFPPDLVRLDTSPILSAKEESADIAVDFRNSENLEKSA